MADGTNDIQMTTRYRLSVPCAQLRTIGGSSVHLYRGQVLPLDIAPGELERMVLEDYVDTVQF